MINLRMLVVLFSFLFFADKNSIAQTYKTYKDAVNHFEITIPANWSVTKSNPRLKFIAIRPQAKNYNSIPENVNLNFIQAPNGNLDAAYNMSIESNSALDGFLSIDKKGSAKNHHYKWYINTHKDLQSGLVMQSIVFVYYFRQKAILLTCTAAQENFEKHSLIFFKIADSLRLN
ncbi:MAG: hypothetical protein EOP42_03655 [Sphingobacteriaceae bacterium]|nr:MAG: hypothetical protein EOP42_03655 [Sphingobacteriaceae bacterium]